MTPDMLEDRIAVITGATRGIGREIALCLAARKARLVLTGRDGDALHSLAEESGGRVLKIIAGDVADAGVARACQMAADEAGGCDVLVNTAGIFPTALLPDANDEVAR